MKILIDTEEQAVLFLKGGNMAQVKELMNSLPESYQDYACGPYIEVVEREVKKNIPLTAGDA